jgi:hypothetical protein
MQPTKAWAPGGDVNFRQCYGCGAETYGDVLCVDCRQDPAYYDATFFLEGPAIELFPDDVTRQGPAGRIGWTMAEGVMLTLFLGVTLGAGLVLAIRLAGVAAHWWHVLFGG